MNIYDKRNRRTVQATLRQGAASDFWQIIRDSLNDTIQRLKKERESDDLVLLPPSEFKSMVVILDSKIRNLELLQNIPETLTAWLEAPEAEQTNFDPYFQAKDMERRS